MELLKCILRQNLELDVLILVGNVNQDLLSMKLNEDQLVQFSFLVLMKITSEIHAYLRVKSQQCGLINRASLLRFISLCLMETKIGMKG